MFDNVSQVLVYLGAKGLAAISLIRTVATALMMLSIYKDAKAKSYSFVWLWVAASYFWPLPVRLVYFLFHRYITKKELTVKVDPVRQHQGYLYLLMAALVYILSVVVMIASAFSLGGGIVRSLADDEPLIVSYDRNGTEYPYTYHVPFYDRDGNVYRYDADRSTFFQSYYSDGEGTLYERARCYVDEDGYFFYDRDGILTEDPRDDEYMTDGVRRYRSAFWFIVWDKEGDVYERKGKHQERLFSE